MRSKSLAALVLVAAVGAAAAVGSSRSGGPGPPASGVLAAPPPTRPLLGFVDARSIPRSRAKPPTATQPQRLVRIDPDTLRPRGDTGVGVGSAGCAARSGGQACWTIPPWSFSPDRTLLAVARNHRTAARSLRLVRIGRMRVEADVPIAGGAVGLIAWPVRRRILAVQEVCCDERQRLLVVDVARRRVAASRPLGGTVVRAAHTARELVLLVAPAKRIGPARLAVVDSRGAIRSATLERILAGSRRVGRLQYRVEQRALAVDPTGRRAFVMGRKLVADVDLVSGVVSHHELARPASLLGRLRDWLDPVAHAKGATGPTRSAVWLGGGILAVTGADEESFTDARDRDQTRIRPAGLSLVDTRNWTARTIDRGATDVRVAGDLLLATGFSWDTASGEEQGIGLTAYGLDGDKRFQLFDGRQAWIEQVYDGRAYVRALQPDGRAPLRVVDLAAGRALGPRARPLPWLLLDPASSWWDG
jgi:hypothetical protein